MKIKQYLQDTYTELVEKVSWPTWAELQSSSIVVMVAVLIFSVVVFAMDFTFEKLMTLVYSIFA